MMTATAIRPHWIRKDMKTDDALRVEFAPSTKVCSNIWETTLSAALPNRLGTARS